MSPPVTGTAASPTKETGGGAQALPRQTGGQARVNESQLAAAVVLGVHRLVKQSTLYTTENEAQTRQIALTQRAVLGYGRRTGRNPKLFFTETSVFVCGRLLRAGRGVYEAALELGKILARFGIDEVTVGFDVSTEELAVFQEHVAQAIRRTGLDLRAQRYRRIRLKKGVPPGRRPGKQDDQLTPEERIVRTYATSIVVMRRFLQALPAGLETLPNRVRRIAQQFSDLGAVQSPAFLGTMALYNARHEHAGRAVNTAMIALGMARQITDDKRLLSRLALACLLYDVGVPRVFGTGPLGEDQVGLNLPTLIDDQIPELPAATAVVTTALGGMSAVSKTTTVLIYEAIHLARRDVLGAVYEGARAPTLEANIVAVARRFNELIADPEEQHDADDAVRALWHAARDDETNQTAVRLLMGALGLFPTGTLVSLASGGVARVERVSNDPKNFSLPTIRPVLNAAGGTERQALIDLATGGGPRITGIVGFEDIARGRSIESSGSVESSRSVESGGSVAMHADINAEGRHEDASRSSGDGAPAPARDAFEAGAAAAYGLAAPSPEYEAGDGDDDDDDAPTPPSSRRGAGAAAAAIPIDVAGEVDAEVAATPTPGAEAAVAMPPATGHDLVEELDWENEETHVDDADDGRDPVDDEDDVPSMVLQALVDGRGDGSAADDDPGTSVFAGALKDMMFPRGAGAGAAAGAPATGTAPKAAAMRGVTLPGGTAARPEPAPDRPSPAPTPAPRGPGPQVHAPAPAGPARVGGAIAMGPPPSSAGRSAIAPPVSKKPLFARGAPAAAPPRASTPAPESAAAPLPRRQSSTADWLQDRLTRARPTAQGDLQKTPVVHLLVYVLDRALTGTLMLVGERASTQFIYLDQGIPAKARTHDKTSLLSDILAEMGQLNPQVLAQTQREAAAAGILHGQHLVRRGLLDRRAVEAGLSMQVARKVASMVGLPPTTKYAFYASENFLDEYGGPQLFPVEPLGLVMEGVRGLGRGHTLLQTLHKLGAAPLRLRREADLKRLHLDEEERRVVELMRVRPMTLRDLVEREVAPVAVVQRTVYALVIARYLNMGGNQKPPVASGRPPVDEPWRAFLRPPAASPTEVVVAPSPQRRAAARRPQPRRSLGSMPAAGAAARVTPVDPPAGGGLPRRGNASSEGGGAVAPRGRVPARAGARAPGPAGNPPRAGGHAVPQVSEVSEPMARRHRQTGPGALPRRGSSSGGAGRMEGRPPGAPPSASRSRPSAPGPQPAGGPRRAAGAARPPSAARAGERASRNPRQGAGRGSAAAASRPGTPGRERPRGGGGTGLERAEISRRAQTIDNQTFYEILNVPPTAPPDAVQAAFFGLAKQWHPDRLPPALQDMKTEVARVFGRMNEAFQTLSDAEKRQEYDSIVKQGGGTARDREIVERAVDSALLFQKGEVLFKKGAYPQAEELVQQAADADPDQPEYQTLLAWIQAYRSGPPEKLREGQTTDRYDRQIEILDEVLEREPEYERARFYRGTLLKRAGHVEQAYKDFRMVMQLNPRNIDAAREVRLHKMRKKQNESSSGGGLLGRFFKKK
ncbi:MAG: DnaJ domain-containing protein [Myxococcota bacterium]